MNYLKLKFNRLSHTRYLSRQVRFILDLSLSVCCTAFALAFAAAVFSVSSNIGGIAVILALSCICSAVGIFCFQIYKGVIRHSSFVESGRIGMASLIKVALLDSVLFFSGFGDAKILIAGAAVDVFLTFFMLIVVRVTFILVYNRSFVGNRIGYIKENMLLFDSNASASALTVSSLRSIGESYHISGFVKFGKKDHYRINGYPVYSIRDEAEFERLVSRRLIKAVLFLSHASVKEDKERLVRYCEKRRIKMLVMPPVNEVKDGNVSYSSLPEVRIEDLLEREEIRINMEEIMREVKNRVIMVTGAAGSIGSELCRQLCSFGVMELVLFDCAETPMHNIRLELEEKYPNIIFHPVMGDVRNSSRVEAVFERFSPHTVFHAAAYKHVPLMEEHPCEAVGTNVGGTVIVANAAVRHGVDKFVMISTDKAVNPTNVMGASKRLAEIYIQSLGINLRSSNKKKTGFVTTRFGNVLGSNGSVIPRFREQLLKGGPLTVTHPDIIRYFMTIPEACRLVLEAACMGEGNEIFVFDMGDPVKIDHLARRMIELAGLELNRDIKIEYTGLRPGEKLFEELLATKETTLSTLNKKIFRAKVREYDYKSILPRITLLCNAAMEGEILETVRMMKHIVPEFKSKCSEFEALDEAFDEVCA